MTLTLDFVQANTSVCMASQEQHLVSGERGYAFLAFLHSHEKKARNSGRLPLAELPDEHKRDVLVLVELFQRGMVVIEERGTVVPEQPDDWKKVNWDVCSPEDFRPHRGWVEIVDGPGLEKGLEKEFAGDWPHRPPTSVRLSDLGRQLIREWLLRDPTERDSLTRPVRRQPEPILPEVARAALLAIASLTEEHGDNVGFRRGQIHDRVRETQDEHRIQMSLKTLGNKLGELHKSELTTLGGPTRWHLTDQGRRWVAEWQAHRR